MGSIGEMKPANDNPPADPLSATGTLNQPAHHLSCSTMRVPQRLQNASAPLQNP